MKKSHEFGKSVRVAISFLTNFTHQGALLTKQWKNFIWFFKIVPGKIIKKGEDFSGSSKFNRLERRISFYGYKSERLATVYLKANEFTNTDGSKPIFWKVVAVRYRTNYDESRIFVKPEWVTIRIKDEDTVLH